MGTWVTRTYLWGSSGEDEADSPSRKAAAEGEGEAADTSSSLITPQPFNGAHSKLHSFWGRILNALCLHFS